MFATSLLAVLLLCSVVSTTRTVVVRNSPVKLPFTKHLNVTMSNIVRHDQARAKALQARVAGTSRSSALSSTVGNEPVDNQAVAYVTAIGVGTPPTTCECCGDN
jgi:cathepsin E